MAASSDNAAAVKIGLIISDFPLLEGHRSIDADITIEEEGGVTTDAPDPHAVQNSDRNVDKSPES